MAILSIVMLLKRLPYLFSLLAFIFCCWSCGDLREEYGEDAILADIRILEDRRATDTVRIADWSTNPDSLIRQRTACAIGIVADTAYLPYLKSLLHDSSRIVLLEAIFAAGQLGDSSLSGGLLNYSRSTDSTIKAEAISALSKIGDGQTANRLKEILIDTLETNWVRALVAESMHRLKDEGTLAALIELARIEDNDIRESIYYALLRRTVPEMQRLFRIGMRDTLEQIKIYSVIGAGRSKDTSAIERIAPLLSGNNWRLKYHALNTVGRLKLMPLVKAVTNLLRDNEHVYIRQAAIRTLGELGSSSVTNRLRRFLDGDNVNLASEALVALAKTNGELMTGKVDEFASSSEQRHRIAAVQAYSEIGGDSALAMIELMFADSVAAVRGEVLENAFAFERHSITATFVERGIVDPDILPFSISCMKLAEERMELQLPAICQRFDKSNGEEGYDFNKVILETIREFGDSLEPSPEVETVISAALFDEHFSIRRLASEVAKKLSLPSVYKRAHFKSDVTLATYREKFERFATNPRATIVTTKGEIEIELRYDKAPRTVNNFIELAENGFYDRRVWHRVVPNFVIQDGCPRGDGWGGPGYEIRCEYNDLYYVKGSVGMATSGKDTGGSQYFICQSAQPHLDGRYTLFGQVTRGFRTVTLVEAGDSIYTVTITTPENK